jgi:hypothetical protein
LSDSNDKKRMGNSKSRGTLTQTDFVTSSSTAKTKFVLGTDSYEITEAEHAQYLKVLEKFNSSERLREMSKEEKEKAAIRLAVPSIVRKVYFDYTFKKETKVKLVIVELENSLARQVLSPVMSFVGKAPAFGLYHTALSFGPKLLDWNDSSICVPRDWKGARVVLAVDLCKITNEAEFNIAIDRICERITYWNTYVEYSQNDNNCQKFTDDLCSHLNIELRFVGATAEYIKRLRTTGRCEAKFDISESLAKLLGQQPGQIEFKTHEELDEFYQKMLAKASMHMSTILGASDDTLLKAYDRAFWFRHKRDKTVPECKPHPEGCPFGDPSFASLEQWH